MNIILNSTKCPRGAWHWWSHSKVRLGRCRSVGYPIHYESWDDYRSCWYGDWRFSKLVDSSNWSGEIICSSSDNCSLPVYECIFTKIGLWLPFSYFEVVILKHLKVPHSQLHTEAWAYMKMFQYYTELKSWDPSLGCSFTYFIWCMLLIMTTYLIVFLVKRH